MSKMNDVRILNFLVCTVSHTFHDPRQTRITSYFEKKKQAEIDLCKYLSKIGIEVLLYQSWDSVFV